MKNVIIKFLDKLFNFNIKNYEIELGNNVEELLDKDRPKKEIIPIHLFLI